MDEPQGLGYRRDESMTEARPTTEELRETVARMERSLASSDSADVAELLRLYRQLIPRFTRDLLRERDVQLSRGAALMLIQAVEDRRRSPRETSGSSE
jgi:hypothetical protein